MGTSSAIPAAVRFHVGNYNGAHDRLLRGDADEEGAMLVEKFYMPQPRA
jgi:hypothetical protein